MEAKQHKQQKLKQLKQLKAAFKPLKQPSGQRQGAKPRRSPTQAAAASRSRWLLLNSKVAKQQLTHNEVGLSNYTADGTKPCSREPQTYWWLTQSGIPLGLICWNSG